MAVNRCRVTGLLLLQERKKERKRGSDQCKRRRPCFYGSDAVHLLFVHCGGWRAVVFKDDDDDEEEKKNATLSTAFTAPYCATTTTVQCNAMQCSDGDDEAYSLRL